MAGVLDFSSFIGGPDNLQILQAFPSTQKVFTYDFGSTVSSYLFAVDYQTIVVAPEGYVCDALKCCRCCYLVSQILH